MACSVSLPPLFFLCFLLSATFSTSFPSPSSTIVSSNQLKFWAKNVHSTMPNCILQKLSPLSVGDSDYFASLLSKKSFSENANFCSLASLACSSQLNSIRPLANGYQQTYQNNKVSPSMEQTDPFSFFRLSVLKEGKTIRLPKSEDNYPNRAFLPAQIASKISLSSNGLREIFPSSFTSPVTKEAILMTLLHCGAQTPKGEIKSCPKSMEEMIEFSKTVLGTKKLASLTSKGTMGFGKELLIGKIERINAKKTVACHELFLPFAIYYCHLVPSTNLYAVDLIDPNTKVRVNTAIATCHMDTSAWPKSHVALKLLKLKPGQGEACHWITPVDLVWISDEKN